MNTLFAAAQEVQDFLQQRGWRFCFIGGLALLRWGRPRTTLDVDVSVFAGYGDEAPYIRELLARFSPRIQGAAEFARDNRVVLIEASNKVPVDLVLGAVPLEEEAVRRATPFEFAPGVVLTTCSAEDLVVLKAFASRDQDWADVKAVVACQADQLDWNYVERQLRPLSEVKDTPDILVRLANVRRETEK